MTGWEQEKKLNKVVRERTFKVRLSEAEYQLMDSNNPYGSIAKLLRQSALDEVVKIHNSKVFKLKGRINLHPLLIVYQLIFLVCK